METDFSIFPTPYRISLFVNWIIINMKNDLYSNWIQLINWYNWIIFSLEETSRRMPLNNSCWICKFQLFNFVKKKCNNSAFNDSIYSLLKLYIVNIQFDGKRNRQENILFDLNRLFRVIVVFKTSNQNAVENIVVEAFRTKQFTEKDVETFMKTMEQVIFLDLLLPVIPMESKIFFS